MKKTIKFLKFGLKLTCRRLKARPCITSTKAIGLLLFLAVYGLGVSFAVNVIEAQGACSAQLTCSGTELTNLGINTTASSAGELKVNGNAYITGGELRAKWLHSTAPGDNTFVGNVGIGTTEPGAKLDVSGGVKIGNSSGANSGTIRWTGSEFEGYYPSTGWQPIGGEGVCPNYFNDTGYGYCIQRYENSAKNWHDASDHCADVHNARLCTASEWYNACVNNKAWGMTGNWEWVDERDSRDGYGLSALVRGDTGCLSVKKQSATDKSHAFRCCRNK